MTKGETMREALERIAGQTCACHDSADENWHGERCPKGIALKALAAPVQVEVGAGKWTCEACGCKSDDIGEYRDVCGKCFRAIRPARLEKFFESHGVGIHPRQVEPDSDCED